jgi:nicotinate-nucleotide--dimethylbenzimidazole phosphoribosyltransferase
MENEQVWARLDALAKPQRSLGRLEELAVRLATTQRTLKPETRPRRIVLFAGDHGVVESGVSAWPSAVTGLMIGAILAGRASSTALAAAQDCDVRLVDTGVISAPPSKPPAFFRAARVAAGTRDLSVGPAMSLEEFEAAWEIGVGEARRAVSDGNRVLITGEMGIGNTTPASCLTMLLADASLESAVGRGAGADDSTLRRKREIVAEAVGRVARSLASPVDHGMPGLASAGDRATPTVTAADPREAIGAVAGFEIVAMAGFFAEGARQGATLLLDGFVATSAALIAERLAPGTTRQMIAAHLSVEPGHRIALAHLGLEPLLDWNMRLGEGTGALVALPLLDSAAALLRDVATLSELGVGRGD